MEHVPTNSELSEISTLVRRQIELENDIQRVEEALGLLKDKLFQVQCVDIPNAMAQAGVAEITLPNGQKISVKETLSVGAVSPKSEHYQEALGWLRDHNLADLIKNEVKVMFGKGEEAGAKELIRDLEAHGWNNYENTVTVHAQTVKAMINERLKKGHDVPLDLFGANVITKATIK